MIVRRAKCDQCGKEGADTINWFVVALGADWLSVHQNVEISKINGTKDKSSSGTHGEALAERHLCSVDCLTKDIAHLVTSQRCGS